MTVVSRNECLEIISLSKGSDGLKAYKDENFVTDDQAEIQITCSIKKG
jgi:hypothetical protein